MNSLKIFFLLGLVISYEISQAAGKNWAVILVGFNYYPYSFALEATAYRTYNNLRAGGIPPENIIVFSPDTAAFHPRNLVPGLVPYAYNGTNYEADSPKNEYDDVVVDYSGYEWGLNDFFDVLAGKSENKNLTIYGSGRVVKSGPNDNIYLHILTLGFPGLFVLNNWNILWPEKFIPFIESLAEENLFNKMFIHFESPSAGAMFDNYLDLDKKIIVYSMGGRYEEFTMCHLNPHLGAYTSICASYEHSKYLEKALSKNGKKETILDLFSNSGLVSTDIEVVHNLYGQFSLANEKLNGFLGPKFSSNAESMTNDDIMSLKRSLKDENQKRSKPLLRMLADDVDIPKMERNKIAANMEQIISKSIKNTNVERKSIDEMTQVYPIKNSDCYKSAVTTVWSRCFDKKNHLIFPSYGERFARLCNADVPKTNILKAVTDVCGSEAIINIK